MSRDRLESREELRALLGLDVTAPPAPGWDTTWTGHGDGYALHRIGYPSPDGDEIPALLLVPDAGRRSGAAVVVFHQHNGQWHLGKSEVAGLAGDPLQALGPALAAAGVTVLAPDAVGFEDRRRGRTGTQPHGQDADDHLKELTHRLVVGDTLTRKGSADAMAAVSLLRALDGVEPDRVGVAGHSFGGHVTLFAAAVDDRVSFACASGCAGSFRQRIAAGSGIGIDQVVPGIANLLDFETLVALAAPRPYLVVAGEDDRHAADAAEITSRAAPAYERLGAADAVRCEVRPGGHALDPERRDLIVAWLLEAAEVV